MKKIVISLSILMGILLANSCGNKATSKFADFEKLEEGLYIKFVEKNESGRAVNVGEIITVDMIYSLNNDSILFDSREMEREIQIPVDSSRFAGDINTAFLKLNEGDSATFILDGETFFTRVARMRMAPDYIDSTSLIYFTLRVREVQTREERQASREAENEMKLNEEAQARNAFLEENNITAEARKDGLIIVTKVEGNGKVAKRGKKVKVHYAGRLLNGTYFDTSIEEVAKANGIHNPNKPYQPLEFTIGRGQVIQGWDKGVNNMKEGGKAQFIIPSELAYGKNPGPGGKIPSYSTLVFDVELIEVVD